MSLGIGTICRPALEPFVTRLPRPQENGPTGDPRGGVRGVPLHFLRCEVRAMSLHIIYCHARSETIPKVNFRRLSFESYVVAPALSLSNRERAIRERESETWNERGHFGRIFRTGAFGLRFSGSRIPAFGLQVSGLGTYTGTSLIRKRPPPWDPRQGPTVGS